MHCWSADNREDKMEHIAHQSQSVLDLEAGCRKTPKEKVNVPESCEAVRKAQREEKIYAALWQLKIIAPRSRPRSTPARWNMPGYKSLIPLLHRHPQVAMNQTRPLQIAALTLGSITVATSSR